MKQISKLSCVLSYLPSRIRGAVLSMSGYEQSNLQEIRLRLGRKLTVTLGSKEYFLSRSGKLSESHQDSLDITSDDINYVFKLAVRESVHSFRREIAKGYVTVNGGCRIGFCGTAVSDTPDSTGIYNVKDISSVNIRIAREIIGCSEELYEKAFADGICGLLVAGPPSSGKTTVLRDLARRLGSISSVSLIDERCEIASVCGGVPQNDVGVKTDVFSSYDRYDGLVTAVRVMSPKIIVCDEIGSREDGKALVYAVNSGVKLIASCHCSSISEAKSKPLIKKLLKLGAFDCIALLGVAAKCGKLVDIAKL